MRRVKRIWGFCLCLSTILQTRIATADGIPPPMLYEAVQEQQNVKVTVRQQADWIDVYTNIAMLRIQGDEEMIIVSDIHLPEKEPTEEVNTCGHWLYAPVDMDGSAECCLDCTTYLDFDFIDHCVPPESTEYRLRPYGMGSASIDVVDSGDVCEAPSTDETFSANDSEYSDASVITDESESSDEVNATDKGESFDETESSDKSSTTDEVKSSGENSKPAAPTADSKSDGGCGCVHISHRGTAAPMRLVELLIRSAL
jgi:hypothetical protein